MMVSFNAQVEELREEIDQYKAQYDEGGGAGQGRSVLTRIQ